MLDKNTIVLFVGINGWRVVEFSKLHPDSDQPIRLVRICLYLYEKPIVCLGTLDELERMSFEEISKRLEDELRKFGELGR